MNPLSQPIAAAAGAQQINVALLCSTTLTAVSADPKRTLEPVKRLVRHRATRHYFKNGDWTADPLQASVFADSVDAVQACVRYDLTDVELALRIGTRTCDLFSTPLR